MRRGKAPQRDGVVGGADLWQRSDFDLHTLIKGSAMTYLPLSRLRRNLATVIGNTGDDQVVRQCSINRTRCAKCGAQHVVARR